MKKNLLAAFTGIFLLLVTGITANGQRADVNSLPSGDVASFGKSISKNTSVMVDRNNLKPRLVKNFLRTFKNVSDEKWFELQDGHIAMFSRNDIDYQVAYDKKGKWLRTIRSYSEAKLSGDLRHTVKSIYYDYEINLVQEIETPNDPITYIIQLNGKTELIQLRISDGEMVVAKKFTKSE